MIITVLRWMVTDEGNLRVTLSGWHDGKNKVVEQIYSDTGRLLHEESWSSEERATEAFDE